MTSGIEWVASQCRLLQRIGEEFERTRPFAGLTIGTGIHLEPKTVTLLLTLHRGGARVLSTGNLNTTQPESLAYLNDHGVEAIGEPTQDDEVRLGYIDRILDAEPDLLLDNGGDMFARWLERPYARLRGGTEETTSGRIRLVPLRDRLNKPILVINDSPLKQFAENRHAVGQGTVEAFLRITNKATNGRRVVVFGYGSVGKGVALSFARAHAAVSVIEIDPVLQMEALWDGFMVPDRDAALAEAEIVITVTAARDVITARDLVLLRNDAILINAGHAPVEIDVAGMTADPSVAAIEPTADGISTFVLRDGRRIHLLTDGHMVNLAGPRPLGNSIESMDVGFALQARCLEAVAKGDLGRDSCVVPVPRRIDEWVATASVELTRRRQRGS